MKNLLGLVLIGLLIRNGLADVSHLSKHDHNHNGYLPPQTSAHNNLFIEQDYNGINSQQSDNEDRGYLPPYQGHSQYHDHHQHHHDHHHEHHQHSQQEEHGYLPPPPPPLTLKHQEQSHNDIHNHQQQLDTNQGYLPPDQDQSHAQEDQGYLPPYKGHDHHHHHHNNQQYNQEANVDPNLQVSYYNNKYAISQQPSVEIAHDHIKNSNSNQEYEDNSHGYNYSPPNQGFEESHEHHHHQAQQNDNLIVSGPQPAVNVAVPSSQNSFQNSVESSHQVAHQGHHHESSVESHLQSQELNTDHNEDQHQQDSRDYLPPSTSIHEHTNTLSINQGTEEAHQGDDRGYLPPIGALELPQSSDTLHIVPPSKLGLPIQKSINQPETSHINVPLPIPQAGYYFIPAVMTELSSLTSANNIPAFEGHQQQNQQHQYQHFEQQELLPTNEIPSTEYFRPSQSEIRIIPSVQTAQEIASQGYLTPSQVVSQHQHAIDINFASPNSNHREVGQQQNFPPFIQTQQQDQFINQNQHQLVQNQNDVQLTHQQSDQLPNTFRNFAQSAVHGVSNYEQNQISSPLELSSNNNNGYLPPIDNNYQQQQGFQNLEAYNNEKQSDVEIHHHNQVTNLQTYMDNVNPNDRYGSLQFQPQHATESNPPPVNPPIMFSKPSAVEAYAPGMAYKVPSNVPFNSFSQAGYLPPPSAVATSSKSKDSQTEYVSSIGFELNEETKKELTQKVGHDSNIFPLANILGVQDDEMAQIMEQLQGHIRTIQITNHHDHSVKNIRVHDSSNQAGERTIEILGPSDKTPMGEHKVLHVISKVPSPQVIHHTIKIFDDSKEVVTSKPTNNDYLPPSNIETNNIYKFRRSY